MNKPNIKPDTLCMAPWTHTYISPQSERRLCCASREPAQNFKQYIDTADADGVYNPLTLDEWWNSEHVKTVRKKMMNNEVPEECQVCNHKLLNTDVYRSYFWHLFQHKYEDIWDKTDENGYTQMKPVSWDYRFSNLCNFKCRMCGDMLSSSWESEERKHNMIDLSNPKNNWMRPDVKQEISKFQDTVVRKEFQDAVDEHRVEEIYWVGGEPLTMEEHWDFMKQIVDNGDGGNVYARYNTNLSRVEYKGVNLYTDILAHIRDWQICASLDGTGKIGEYIRTGLKYEQWLTYYKQAQAIQTNPRQMRIDFTLTLPGLFEVKNIINLSKELNTMLLAKVTFAFTPDIVMSPLCLPKKILHKYVNNLITEIKPIITELQQPMLDVLENLLTRPTFEDEWQDWHEEGISKGKKRILTLENIRNDEYTMDDILKQNKEIYDWWKAIT
jgi:hypothetical protein